MQQRRVRLGDILDDYCPRERRITNHAVVAMIDDTVKQTRCTTCDADHEYKKARIPAPRRRKTGALTPADLAAAARPRPAVATVDEQIPDEEPMKQDEPLEEPQPVEADAEVRAADAPDPDEPAEDPASEDTGDRDEWPVHRPLIRATLPRPEGQTPERKAPDFTVRPTGGGGGRFDPQRNGQRTRNGHRPMRHGQGQPSGQGPRFGGSRPGPGQGQRQGAGPNAPPGQRQGNRPGPGGAGRPGPGRGPRPGGSGRKRGR